MDIFQIFSLIGISSIVSVVITYFLDYLKKKQEIIFVRVFEEKYRRFNHLLAHMLLIVDFSNVDQLALIEDKGKDKYKKILHINGEEALKQYLLNELKNYIYFYYLFSNKEVMKLLNTFLYLPTEKSYIAVAKAMKKDLWK